MNERQSIEESIELWEVLAADGNKDKRDVPGPWQDYICRCPLCEFAGDSCSRCPVFSSKYYHRHCWDTRSSFRRWLKARSPVVKMRAAKQLVKLFKEVLKNV